MHGEDPTGTTASVAGAVRERFALHGLDYPVPPEADRLPYMLGGLTFAGIALLFVTGLAMDQFYDPSPIGAHDSVVYLISRVPLGGWVRALHWWGSGVVLTTVAAHLVWVFRRRGYRPPREVTWWSGVAMLALLFALAFTGTVLRADQEGGEALAHAVAGARMSGWAGAWLTPEFTRSAPLLSRIHAAHTSLLPLKLVALVGLHFWLIRMWGIRSDQPRTARFGRHLRRLAGTALVLWAGIGALAAAFPPALGHPAVDGVEITRPFWPFLWIYAAEHTLGLSGMIVAPAALFAFLVAVPLLDRGERRPAWLAAAGALVLALMVAGLIYGALAPRQAHLM